MSKPLHCNVRKTCGACQFLAVPYSKQLAEKQQQMEDLFNDVASEATVLSPISGMDDPRYYRNKVTSPFVPGKKLDGRGGAQRGAGKGDGKNGAGKNGRSAKGGKQTGAARDILCGMYAAGTHRVIDTSDCLLENQVAKRVIASIRQIMLRYGMEPYNEDVGTGFVRHAVVRVGHGSGEVLVTVVTNGAQFPASKNFCRELKRRVPEVTTVVQNVNTRQTNVILGTEEHVLYGPGFILDTLCGLSFRISSHSFYQVNATQTEVLYRRAIEMAKLTGTETVLDAYCGTGTIGLVAAHGLPDAPGAHAARVIGVDNVESAIHDARENARHNGIENADFTAADAGAFMRERAAAGERLDVLLMDPPRAGSSKEFLEATVQLAPERIVYISCNPLTQVRDVEYLVKHGYRLEEIQPVDMFPHTKHVENIVSLVR